MTLYFRQTARWLFFIGFGGLLTFWLVYGILRAGFTPGNVLAFMQQVEQSVTRGGVGLAMLAGIAKILELVTWCTGRYGASIPIPTVISALLFLIIALDAALDLMSISLNLNNTQMTHLFIVGIAMAVIGALSIHPTQHLKS